jgi:ABC-type uncharacterized transport system involved in gliding motility auxiliary subunit
VNDFKASGIKQVLAARITGTIDTAFPNGPPPPQPGDNQASPAAPPALVKQSQKPIDIIVVADTDLLGNDMNVDDQGQPVTQNTDFIINALDSLSGGGQLIALRSHGVSFRPFTTVDAIEAAANEKYRTTQEKLQADLKDTQDKLAALRGQNGATDAGSTPAEGTSAQQQQAIAQFNQRIVDVRQQLRNVSGELRAEIDALGDQLRLINILGIPVLIIIVGIIASIWRRLRLSRYLRRRQPS